MTTPLLRIGTRGSPLALWQANATRDALLAAHGLPPEAIAIDVIRTTGDAIQDRALSEAGGKGLFTKEIEDALLAGSIDLAVHSAKDMPTRLPPGLVLAGYLPRADIRDAFISATAATPSDLPPGALVGTASLRRQALIRRARPDIRVDVLRGNVETRLRRIREGAFAATFLAAAGLSRLGLLEQAACLLDPEEFPPAVGQGAIALETRAYDPKIETLIAPILHADTGTALIAERTFLDVLDGSCRTPIAGLARVRNDRLTFKGLVLTADGTREWSVERSGSVDDAERIGRDAGHEIRARLPAGVLDLS